MIIPHQSGTHNRGEFFWTRQTESETPEDFWQRLIEIEKECAFEGITAEDLLISKFMTAITDTKLRDKLMKEKKLELKKTLEMIKQNTYERKNRKNTIPEALILHREKEIKEDTIQRMERSDTRPKNKFTKEKSCKFCKATNWNPTHKCPALGKLCNNCGKKGHFARVYRQRDNYKRKVRNVTEDESEIIGGESDESETSIHRIERINRITDRNKCLTAVVKVNGIEKEFIVDTGSPISLMPVDEKILKQTEIQKVKQRYQDVNKNEVKLRWKIPANIEYENNKKNANSNYRKKRHYTITRNGLDKKIQFDNRKYPNGRYQSVGKETSDRKVPRFIQEQHHNKRYRNKYSAETGTLSGETKSKTDPITSTRGGRERTRKIDKNRTSGKGKTRR